MDPSGNDSYKTGFNTRGKPRYWLSKTADCNFWMRKAALMSAWLEVFNASLNFSGQLVNRTLAFH